MNKNLLIFTRAALALFFIVYGTISVTAQGVTHDHIAQMKSVGAAVISDNGSHVAYTLSVPADPVKENVPAQNHLYILNVATGQSKPYFTSSGVSGISWRPGKSTLTFLSKGKDESANSLYEVSVDGGEASKIFNHGANILSYTWRNDGSAIAYTIKESAKAPATPLPYKPDFYEEEMAEQKCFIVHIREGKMEPQPVDVKGTVYHLQWSKDGAKLALSAAPTPAVDDSYMKQKVFVVDASTRKVVASIDNEGKLGGITWSPDGKQLALHAGRDIHDPTDGRIMTVSASGGKPKIIDENFQGKYENITWTDAGTIHFHASISTASALGSIRTDGTGKQIIFQSGEHSITSFSRASNGSYAFTANTPTHPTELFTLSAAKGSRPVRRTLSNDWLKSVQLGKQEVVKYKARDGKYDIEGMLIYPVNYSQGDRVPLITVVHGGPEAHYSNGWLTAYSMPGQMAAATGYAVFYPNYRGSTGRGIEFIYSSQGDQAGKEFDDVVDGIDFLIEKGIVDTKRVGVTGGSYGGYASAWMSTYYSKRFAAAVMFVGISNNLSLWGTSDIPEEMYLVHARKRLWDDWQGFLQTSPIYHVDKAQTPLLIMHGAVDPRVHPAQSLELYRHMKVRKPEVPVRLIYYPGEGHGNTRSASRYDYNLRMMQWFDTYLKTGNARADKPILDLPVNKK
jgi:dipeptidyl aminopeptidase/acylaminoacyl peptidase